MQRTGFDIQ